MKFKFYYIMLLPFPLFIMSLIMFMNSTTLSLSLNLIQFTSLSFPITMMLDWVSCMFLTTVILISSMIMIFSTEYIPKLEHNKFYSLLLLFVLSMSLLIISDNLIFILLGWDGLGLSSYILVIYYQNSNSAASGSITVFSNRLGDIFIILAISMMFMNPNWNFNQNEFFFSTVMLLLCVAACTKSAQFPFSAWLPAAMAAPTPISALVHSSTLVTAGVYLLIRTMNNPHPTTMSTLLLISSLTVIYASMAACWEQDLKKIIALSTLSQIAMMMFAISMNSILLAFFHLITHALFKSMMFMAAGNLIHSSSYQDMRFINFFSSIQSPTFLTMGISNMALMGIPFMSGFFSKDSILEFMMSNSSIYFLPMIMIMSIGMTASYSFRLIFKSSKFLINSKPDFNVQMSQNMSTSMISMIPYSIFMGAMLLWIISPEQTFIIPDQIKKFILLMIISGIILGTLLNFKIPPFLKLGFSGIFLWFNHILTCSLNKYTPMMNSFMINDKQWQENYGPTQIFTIFSYMSFYSQMLLLTWMFISFILILILMLIIL